MIDLITNISSLISGIMVIVAFLGVLIKPIRKKIETWLRNTTNAEELTNTMKAHTKQLNNLEYKIDQQETKSKKADEQIINHLKDVDTRLNNVDSKLCTLDNRVFENERDRIKAELSECASRCARGIKLYPEEKNHIDEIYSKYINELHCNSMGSELYHTITKYYESQDWLKT